MQARFTQALDVVKSAPYYCYSSAAYAATIALQYSEKALVGDARKIKKIFGNFWDSRNEYHIIPLGLLGYVFGNNYLVFIPRSVDEKDLKKIISDCDAQPNGRIAYKAFATLSGGPHFFAENSPKIHNTQMRDLKSYFQNPYQYAEILDAELQKLELTKLKELKGEQTKNLVRKTFLKVFFNLDQLPDDLNNTIDSYAKNAFNFADSITGGWEFTLKNIRTKREYQKFAKRFLMDQLDHIMKIIENYPESKGQNIIADVIVKNFRSKNLTSSVKEIDREMILSSFNDPYIQTLPSLFFAGDNTIKVIDQVIRYLDTSLGRFDMELLLNELENNNLKADVNLRTILQSQISNLNHIYKMALRTIPSLIARKTDHEIKVDQITIPAHSKLLIDLSNSFSFGRRSCPGFNIAEIMASTFILRYIASMPNKRILINSYEKEFEKFEKNEDSGKSLTILNKKSL